MSLDVYLYRNGKTKEFDSFNKYELAHLATNYAISCEKGYIGSFDDWFNHLDNEWWIIANKNNPCFFRGDYMEELYWANITHNLGKMADKAGLYEALWRPHRLRPDYNIPEDDYNAEYEFEQKQTILAEEIIPIVEKGLADMKARPEYYKQFDSDNGWGLYIHFIPWIERYLEACKENPTAIIKVSR